MLDPSVTLDLTQGVAIFGCVAVITLTALRAQSNPASPYWITFSVALFASWLTLIFDRLEQVPDVARVFGILFVTVAACALWLGLRIENGRNVRLMWIPVLAAFTSLSAALGLLHPFFQVPRIATVTVLAVGVLIVRESVTGRARANLYAQTIAWTMTFSGILLGTAAITTIFTNSFIFGGSQSNPITAMIFTDIARHCIVSILLICVACLIAKPIRIVHAADRSVDVSEGDRTEHASDILRSAEKTLTGVAVITLTIASAPDLRVVYGQEGLSAVKNYCLEVFRANVSPLALVGEIDNHRLFILMETDDVKATVAVVSSLSHQLMSVSQELSGGFAPTGVFSYADSRIDGYEWDALMSQAEARMRTASESYEKVAEK